MEKKYRVIVAHPNMQHSIKLATSLRNLGYLDSYLTTVCYDNQSILGKILHFFKRVGPVGRFIERWPSELLDQTKTFNSFSGLFFYLLTKIDKHSLITYRQYEIMARRFGKSVAKYSLSRNADAIVMYDFTATSCFEYLSDHGDHVIKILDMSSIPCNKIDAIITNEEKKGFKKEFEGRRKRYTHRRCKYFSKEIVLADFFLVASFYSKKVLLDLGISENKILYVPYGVDNKIFYRKHMIYCKPNRILNFLFVGRIEAPKGIHYLLNAFSWLWKDGYKFVLHMAGKDYMGKKYLKDFSSFIIVHGVLDKIAMIELYNNCDVFVLPSLWEGSSISHLEAMSCGLPAIVTEVASGGVRNYENGFIVEAGSSNDIYQKAKWFLDHTDQIPSMGRKASESVREYSLSNYHNCVKEAFTNTILRAL